MSKSIMTAISGGLCILLAANAISIIRAEGFFNGPVTFGSGDQAHPGGGKSFASVTLGGAGDTATSIQRDSKISTGSEKVPVNKNSESTISNQPRIIQSATPQISVVQTPAPQVRYVEGDAPQVRILGGDLEDGVPQSRVPSLSYLQRTAPQVTISQARPSVSVTGGETSHGYTVAAPGLTKTGIFGYRSGGSLTVDSGAPQVSTVQTPNLQIQVPQQEIRFVQAPPAQLHVLETPAPQIRIVKAPTPQVQVLQAPAPQIQIQQAAVPQIRIQKTPIPQIKVRAQQPQISVSGSATSHGYTVNAPGLTKTATFGYPSGSVSIAHSAPRVTVAQAPNVQLRVTQPQLQVLQNPTSQIKIQQVPAPQIKIQQAPAPQIRIQQAPAPQIRIQQAPAPQIRIQQAPAPQIRIQQAPAPQIRIQQAPAPQIRIQQAPAPPIRIQQVPSQIRVQAQPSRISVSGSATSHGYTVNAPGLTKVATFGYPSGGVIVSQSTPRVSVSEIAPRLQVRLPQQTRAPQINVVQAQAPQISVLQPPASQTRVLKTAAPQLRISAPVRQLQVRTQQPAISVSKPNYSVNSLGLTKTATFGYPSGRVSNTQSAPRVTVSQAPAARLQVRIPQHQIQVVQTPGPQIKIQQPPATQISVLQAPAPQVRVLQAPTSRIRLSTSPQVRLQTQQPKISVSGPATSHGYTVNAPGLTKTATFGYPSSEVRITQSAPRISVAQEASKLQVRVPRQQIQVGQTLAPQIQIRTQQPQLQVLQAPGPQIRIQQAPASQIQVRTQQTNETGSEIVTSSGYTISSPSLTKTATLGYPPGDVTFIQSAPRVSVTEQGAPKLQFQIAQPELRVLQSPAPQIRIHQAPAAQYQLLQSPAPQLHVIETPAPKISLLHSPAPQVHVLHSPQPQVHLLQPAPVSTYSVAAQPQISLVKGYRPQIHVVEAPAPRIDVIQPPTQTIKLEAPKTITTSIPGFSAPTVRRQAFNTPSHGYSVSAPGFTKHKTFSGPSVYGTHQGGGVSGASGIGNVDLSIRQAAKAKAA
ncbi:E1A-binding protein p400-like [Varroa jacobsoni]|uniref:E1A-binding protein p400-like n=1 Tax=Varroa jacobsoni TaxID=62625 RepID=UPI000BF73E6C|nr:E1A-binding protein p400-like [Varroa jacobsoni]